MSGFEAGAGQVAVVTGGGSGIGKALAAEFAARGMTVVIADIEPGALAAAAAETGAAAAIACDVADEASVAALATAVVERFGRVNLVCANAGVASGGPIAAMTGADWRWLLGVNVHGLIHTMGAFLPHLRAAPGGGWLAITASEAGFHPGPGIGGYCVSKYAVVGIGETLATELAAEGAPVGVTLLCPGPVSTRLGSASRNRSDSGARALVDRNLEQTDEGRQLRWIAPAEVARRLADGVARGDLYVFTHPELQFLWEERHAAVEAAYARAALG